jgi:tRNA(fMet)-specific endonuclease VapC
MPLYVLDTDLIGFVQNQHPTVMQNMRARQGDHPGVTTIITFGEDLSGWLPACRRAVDGVSRARAYARLLEGVEFYRRVTCLPFDAAAAAIFDQRRAQKIRIGTNDMAIAAITLSVNGVLVTRNVVDFQRVPGLLIEDWTQA